MSTGTSPRKPQRLPLPGGALVSSTEAARLLGLSRSAFYRLRDQNLLPPAVAVPGVAAPRYRRRDLERYLDRLRPARR